MARYLVLMCCAFGLAGCEKGMQASPLPASAVSSISIVQERIPENSPETAIAKHGFGSLLRIAEEGDRKAQHFIAVAYLMGSSVPKNYAEAQRWGLRAANQGSPASQFLVGALRKDAALSDNLLALQPNSTLAYMWFSLAAAQGHEGAKRERDLLERSMDPAWIDRAQSLAAAWKPCPNSSCSDFEPTL